MKQTGSVFLSQGDARCTLTQIEFLPSPTIVSGLFCLSLWHSSRHVLNAALGYQHVLLQSCLCTAL